MSDMTQVVILGASGDLTARKLLPGLFCSYCQGLFPHEVQVVGVARRPWDTDSFRERIDGMVDAEGLCGGCDEGGCWPSFLQSLYYHQTHLDQAEQFEALATRLDELAGKPANRVFYLAIKPELFLATVSGLHGAGLLDESNGCSARVVVEKPFGYDLATAAELNTALQDLLTENQLYRIDHYLGKETVQNILAFRFRNAFFEPLWNHNHVELIQITVAENIGVGSRGGYYDTSGAVRDILQNHALQLLALVAMEPPASLDADAIRNEKVKVLQSLRAPTEVPDPEKHVVRAQYNGYLDEPGVPADSTTETYTAVRTYIDNWRWGGTPFLLRTGKNLPSRFTSITVQFAMPPHSLFGHWDECHLRPNSITLRIQPEEGIDLAFDVKEPGSGLSMRPAKMTFDYGEFFDQPSPEAYQRLLRDVIVGDQSLFIRSDEVEASWRWADALRAVMVEQPVAGYDPNSWGPSEGENLFAECEGRWVRD